MKAVTLTIAFFSLCSTPASGQNTKKGKWSGEVGVNAGTNASLALTNQNSHHMGSATANLTYSTQKFEVSFNGSGSYDYHFAGEIGMDTNISGTDTTRVVDASSNELRNLLVNGGVSALWKIDLYNRLSMSYSYGFDRNNPTYYTISDGILNPQSILTTAFSRKDSDSDVNSHNAKASYEHLFAKPGRNLNIDVKYTHTHTTTYSEWVTGTGDVDLNTPISLGDGSLFVDGSIVVDGHFRDTPSQEVGDVVYNFKYSDVDFCNIKSLKVDFSLAADLRKLGDHRSAATYVDGRWKDSVEVRENFIYKTISLTPGIHAKYGVGRYEVDGTFSPEFFVKKLDSDGKEGDFGRGEVAQNFTVNNSFKTARGSKLYLNARRSESRPSYLQVCWFPRQSVKYSNEIYVGNPDLQNTTTLRLVGGYDLATKSPFSMNTSITYTHKGGKVEETYTYETIDEREYRVYTWVNGGKSDEFAAYLKLSWAAKSFKTAVIGRYNVYRGVAISGKETKSGDYSLRAEAEYILKAWTFNADITYQSDIVRDYNTVKSIAECNARIARSFGRFFVFIEGNNLLDRPIEHMTKSEDMTEVRHEITKNNRRIFVLGATFTFGK